jgi:Na+/pantothenate symporter
MKIVFLIGAGCGILFIILEVFLSLWIYKEHRNTSLIIELMFKGNLEVIKQLTYAQARLFKIHSLVKKILICIVVFALARQLFFQF